MKKNELTNLIGAYVLIGLIAALVLVFLVIKPLWNNAQKTGREISTVNTKIKELKQLGVDTETLRVNYDQVKSQRDQILQLLPAKSEEERLIALLGDLASKSGVVLGAFAPGSSTVPVGTPSGVAASVNIYPASISIAGAYAGVQAFLQKIEESARFIEVTDTQLSSGGQGNTPLLQARLVLQAYYQQPLDPNLVEPK